MAAHRRLHRRLTRDLDLAEDCVQDAVERALRARPDNLAAWLTTTAHRIALDRLRREATLRRKLPLLVVPEDPGPGPTDPLRLVFTCCHPASPRSR